MKASEFGGSNQKRNGIQPLPHRPDSSEALMLTYRTGDPSGRTDPDSGEVFTGLLPYEEQLAKRTAEGVMKKGQEWDRMLLEAGDE